MSDAAIPVQTLTITPAAAVEPRRFITLAGALPLAGDNAIGVTRSKAAAGVPTPVDVLGLVAVEADSAIAKGDEIEATAVGRAKTKAGNNKVLARAYEAAAAQGDIILAVMIPN